MTDTPSSIRAIIAAELGKHAEGLSDEMTLFDLGADSLDVVGILVEIEDRLGVNLEYGDDLSVSSTVGAAIAVVERVLGEREAA